MADFRTMCAIEDNIDAAKLVCFQKRLLLRLDRVYEYIRGRQGSTNDLDVITTFLATLNQAGRQHKWFDVIISVIDEIKRGSRLWDEVKKTNDTMVKNLLIEGKYDDMKSEHPSAENMPFTFYQGLISGLEGFVHSMRLESKRWLPPKKEYDDLDACIQDILGQNDIPIFEFSHIAPSTTVYSEQVEPFQIIPSESEKNKTTADADINDQDGYERTAK